MTNSVVTEYVRIVKANDAVAAVLEAIDATPDSPTDDGACRADIIWELVDTAIDIGRGGDPNADDAFDALFDRCQKMVPDVRRILANGGVALVVPRGRQVSLRSTRISP